VKDWVEELNDVSTWDANKLEAFTRFVAGQDRAADKWVLLKQID
jgi:hypothetical protein